MSERKNTLSPGGMIGVNAASSAIGGLIGLAGSALQHKYNKDLAQFQYDKNLEMWNKQNEYNSPIAQRKRLESAGLNPALLYGQGSVSAGNSNSMPEYQQMGVDLTNNMLSAMQMAQMSANIRKTNAEATGQEKQNKYIDSRSRAEIDVYLADAKNKHANTNYINKLSDKVSVDITAVQTSIDKMNEEILFMKEQTKNKQTERELMELQKGITVLQQTLLQAQINTENEKPALIRSQKSAQDAETTYKKAMTHRSNEMLPYDQGVALQNINKINQEYLYKKWETDYMNKYGVKPDVSLQQALVNLIAGVSEDISKGIEGTSFPDIIDNLTPGGIVGKGIGRLIKKSSK